MIDDPSYLVHKKWMSRVLELAKTAGDAGEVPVAAAVVNSDGKLVTEAQNRRERDFDPTGHAEILALRQAGQVLQNWHLNQYHLMGSHHP